MKIHLHLYYRNIAITNRNLRDYDFNTSFLAAKITPPEPLRFRLKHVKNQNVLIYAVKWGLK